MTDSALQSKRLIAAGIDFGGVIVLSVGLFIVSQIVGAILGAVSGGGAFVTLWIPRLSAFLIALLVLGYILGRDAFGGGRSLGKKSQDLRVVTESGAPISVIHSVKRNAIFSIGAFFFFLSSALHLVPCLGDAVACLLAPLVILGGLVGLAAAVIELIKVIQDPQGIRFGDQMAGTRVVQ